VSDRRRRIPVRRQLRLLAPLLVVWLPCVVILALVVTDRGVAHEEFFLDPVYSLGGHWYTGLVSQLGIVAWAAGATLAAGGAWLARVGGRRGAAWFLAGGAVVTTVLLFDDLFLLHADLLPRLGIPKPAVELTYLAVTAAWLLGSIREVARTRVLVLAAAIAALGTSLFVDLRVPGADAGRRVVLEDGTKFLGILAWSLWLGLTAHDVGTSVIRDLRQGAATSTPVRDGAATSTPVRDRISAR
jgi:hypothetical protein